MAKTGKNKMKMWRRMSIKGYGRQLRNALRGTNHPAYATQTIINLFAKAGIGFDLNKGKSDAIVVPALDVPESQVVDAEIVPHKA